MTTLDLMALMPLIILTAGCVLCLLAGAVKPGCHLYWTAFVVISAALLWSVLVPVDTAMPGQAVSGFSRACSAFLYGTALVALLLAVGYNRRRGITGEEFPATLLFALVGMGVTCAARDLLMLFLGLEAFTFAFYILVAIEPDSERGGESGLKYLLNGTLSAAILGMGIALVYCSRGSLNIGELGASGRLSPAQPLYLAGTGLMLAGLIFKLSLVPAHLWTADVYQGAPAPVTALLSTASKVAATVALLLIFPLLLPWKIFHDVFWVLALLSMLCGNLAALLQSSIKRMLAWSSVAQMGYMILALVAYSAGGGRAALFYSILYAVAGLASFGAVAVVSGQVDRDALDEYRGLGFSHPLAGVTLAVAMFSLAGIPPAAGFMAKFAVFSAALRAGEVWLALVGILSALVAVFFYLRVVVILYMKPARGAAETVRSLSISETLALAIPLAVMIVSGIFPSSLLELLTTILP